MKALLLQRNRGIASGQESASEGSNGGRNKMLVKYNGDRK